MAIANINIFADALGNFNYILDNHTNQQEFEALFNNAAIGIITINDLGQIVLINQFALNRFGYKEEDVIGKKIEMLIPQRFKDKHVRHRTNYNAQYAHSRPMGLGLDLYAIKKDGTEFPVEVSLSSYNADGKNFAIAFISDITIRKRSEEALMELNAQLEEIVKDRTQSLRETVEKLEVQINEAKEKDAQLRKALEKEKDLNELKSRFVSLASHQFRTPLSTILSSAYLVSKYQTTEEQPKREKHIDRVISSVNMLNDILNDFLSVGKIEEGKIQIRIAEVDIKELIKSLINELNPILKNGQKIIYKHTGDVNIFSDPSLLKHTMMNLISNAIKFSPEDSDIVVGSSVNKNTIQLFVKDYGAGIPEEDKQHLFERFFRATNATNVQGTGLGLHIVGKYVELMNGTIECLSEIGKGTEFIINFDIKNN